MILNPFPPRVSLVQAHTVLSLQSPTSYRAPQTYSSEFCVVELESFWERVIGSRKAAFFPSSPMASPFKIPTYAFLKNNFKNTFCIEALMTKFGCNL